MKQMTTDYQAVILAAGRGTRIEPASAGRPKALLPIGPHDTSAMDETCFLRRQIELLMTLDVSRIVVVAGYKHQEIQAAVAAWQVPAAVVVNQWPDSGNVGSFYRAAQEFPELLGGEGPTLVLDADILYHRDVLTPLREPRDHSTIVVTENTPADDEAVLVYGTPEQPILVGKRSEGFNTTGLPCLGEEVGIVLFTGRDHEAVQRRMNVILRGTDEPEGFPELTARDTGIKAGIDYEELLRELITRKRLRCILCSPALPFIEVDTPADYAAARDMYQYSILPRESSDKQSRSFLPDRQTRLEHIITDSICEPLLRYIPGWIHPNWITLGTFGFTCGAAVLAIGSAGMEGMERVLALCGAGVCTLLTLLGDNLDGMHARRHHTTSTAGALLDHGLDSITTPLMAAALALALQVPAWGLVLITVTAAMVYHAQLVLHHCTGRFLLPDMCTGSEALAGSTAAYFLLAVIFSIRDRPAPWLGIGSIIISIGWIVVQLECWRYYAVRLGKQVQRQVPFIVYLLSFGIVYLLGNIEVYVWLLVTVCIAVRLCSRYIVNTIAGQSYTGGAVDLGLGILVIAMTAVISPEGQGYTNGLTYSLSGYLVLASGYEVLRHRHIIAGNEK